MPQIMGILNCTPDSFSDGGFFNGPEKANARARELLSQGCDWVDIGAESTRPGSKPVTAADEWERLYPCLSLMKDIISQVSVDTRHDETALRAKDLGIRFFNNVNGLYEDNTLKELASVSEARYCGMHMFKTPESMQNSPLDENSALTACKEFFAQTQSLLLECGFSSENIYLDPGVGFGKTDAANLALIQESNTFSDCYNLLYGVSRKSFIGRMYEIDDPLQRDGLSKAYELFLMSQGVKIIRTHNVDQLKKLMTGLNFSYG